MRNLLAATASFLCLASFSANPLLAGEKLTLDAEKSKIEFYGSKPDNSGHKGGFKKFKVDAMADFENADNSSIRIEIDTASLWSDNDKLTSHLKNPDFFDVRKYPKAVFESTSIFPEDDGAVTIVGKLKMLDQVADVKIPMTSVVTDEAVKLNGKFKLDRTKWGMNYGEGKINKDVDMTVELVLKR